MSDKPKSKLKHLRAAAGVTESDANEMLLPGLQRAGESGAATYTSASTSKIMRVLQDIEKDLKEYLEDLETVAHNIDVLAVGVRHVNTGKEESEKVKEMQIYLDQSKQYNMKVKACLDDLETLSKKQAGSLSKKEKDYCHIILTQSSRRFQEGIKKLLASQTNFETATRTRMRKQLQTLYPDASSDEVKDMVEGDPENIRGLIQKQYRRATKSENDALRDQLVTMQDNHDAMLELEQSVIELSELFVYLTALVENQEKQLMTIEEYVDRTDEYVGHGVEKLAEAEVHQASYESKRRCLMCCFVWTAVAGIVALCLILFFCVVKPYCIDNSGGGGSKSSGGAAAGGTTAPAASAKSFAQLGGMDHFEAARTQETGFWGLLGKLLFAETKRDQLVLR